MFLKEVQRGIEGRNKGLNCGLKRFNNFINGIQKKTYYLISASAKTGKTAFLDATFVLYPYLLNKEAHIHWIYYSYEIDLIEKMAKYCAFFMDYKYGVYCDSNYILGRGDNHVKPEHYKLIEEIYNNELIDLFGKYDDNGKQISEGKITFFEEKVNPEGMRKFLMKYAEENGEFIRKKITIKDDDGKDKDVFPVVGYKEKDEDLYTIVMVDHLSIAKKQKGLQTKENIDLISQHLVFFRNICKFTPVGVQQHNRDLGKIERMKFSGEQLQPTLEDQKDSGEPAQDANLVVALFNPTLLPHLRTHLGYDLVKIGKSYRSLHILASRNTESGVNLSLLMEGKTGIFRELPKNNDNERLNEVYEYVKKFN
jgi:hypothetical protein